jgi:hypothetical protein
MSPPSGALSWLASANGEASRIEIGDTVMPEKKTRERAQKAKEEGKAPTTQAGEFVREEIHHVREGKHGARSTEQAIAIGLSKARKAGVKVPPRGGKKKSSGAKKTAKKTAGTKKKTAKKASGTKKKTAKKASGTKKKTAKKALRREGRSAASRTALAKHGRKAAKRRSSAVRSAAARKAAKTKGAAGRSAAARKAAETRAENAAS